MKFFRQEAAATLRLAGPLIAAQLAQISTTFIDTVMAGNLSPKDLASVAVGASIWWAIIFACMGFLFSVNPTVAQLFGAGKHREIGHVVRQGLWLALAVSIPAFFLVRNCRPLLEWLNVSPELIPTTLGFLNAIAFAAPATCGYQALRGFTEGISKTKPVMYASMIALCGNIAGNYIFMYGKLGMPRMGAVGCGVASAIVMWLMFGFMALYIKLNRAYEPFQAFARFEPPDWPQCRALFRLGTPIAISMFMEASLFSTAALLIGAMGTVAVAGHQIALNVASVTFMIPLGLAMAISVRVGQAMGRGDPDAARRAGFTGIALAATFMALSAICIFLFPELIAGLYTNDPAVKNMAVSLLFMAAIFQISDGLQVSGSGALRGLKDTKVPMVITVVAYWVIGMPLGYTLGVTLEGGPRAMWIGFIFGLTAAAVLLNSRFHFATKRLQRLSVKSDAD